MTASAPTEPSPEQVAEPTPEQVAAAKARQAEQARDTEAQKAANERLVEFVARIDDEVPRLPAPAGGRAMCAAWDDHLDRARRGVIIDVDESGRRGTLVEKPCHYLAEPAPARTAAGGDPLAPPGGFE